MLPEARISQRVDADGILRVVFGRSGDKVNLLDTEVLRDLDRPDAAPVVVDELERPAWNPTDEERARLPDRLEWRVEAFDASGQPRAHGGGRAWRGSR